MIFTFYNFIQVSVNDQLLYSSFLEIVWAIYESQSIKKPLTFRKNSPSLVLL